MRLLLTLLVFPPSLDDVITVFKSATEYLASAIEAGAGLIIALAAIEGMFHFFIIFFRHNDDMQAKENIRLGLGRWLALALEFELAADILRTAVAPTWEQIGQLAAIIVIRTVLNYFLQLDIDKAAARRGQTQPPADAHQDSSLAQ